MCHQCNYEELLQKAKLGGTANRLRVLETIGDNGYPLSAEDIFNTMGRSSPINRVTVYRILELLVDRGVVERLSTGGRASYYGMAPNNYHQSHPHFYCKSCGQMDCLNPDSIDIKTDPLWKTFPGRIDKLEVRLDGLCKNCLKQD